MTEECFYLGEESEGDVVVNLGVIVTMNVSQCNWSAY